MLRCTGMTSSDDRSNCSTAKALPRLPSEFMNHPCAACLLQQHAGALPRRSFRLAACCEVSLAGPALKSAAHSPPFSSLSHHGPQIAGRPPPTSERYQDSPRSGACAAPAPGLTRTCSQALVSCCQVANFTAEVVRRSLDSCYPVDPFMAVAVGPWEVQGTPGKDWLWQGQDSSGGSRGREAGAGTHRRPARQSGLCNKVLRDPRRMVAPSFVLEPCQERSMASN